jgi:hypothetical protein
MNAQSSGRFGQAGVPDRARTLGHYPGPARGRPTRRQAAIRAAAELEELARILEAVGKAAERAAALRIASDLRGAVR